MELPEFKSKEELENFTKELANQFEKVQQEKETIESDNQKLIAERNSLKETNTRYLEKLITSPVVEKEEPKEKTNKKYVYKLSE